MRKYKLMLTPSWSIEVPAEKINLRSWDWAHLLYRLSTIIALLSLFLALAVTTYNTLTLNSTQGESVNLYVWATIAVGLAFVAIWQVVVLGRKRVIDPPGFIGILSFALLSILAWIAGPLLLDVPPASLAGIREFNTFGGSDTKALAGLAVISLVGVYYLGNLFLDKRHKIQKALATLLLVLTLSLVMYLVGLVDTNLQYFLPLNALLVLLSWAFTFVRKGSRGDLAFFTIFVVSSASFLIIDNPYVWRVLTGLILTFLGWLWVWLLMENFQFDLRFAGWRAAVKKILNRQEPINRLLEFSLLNTLFVILWLVVLLVLWIVYYQPPISSELSILFAFPQEILAAFSNFGGALMGTNPNLTVLQPETFLYEVITYQGLLGLLAYLVLAGTVIYITVRQAFRDREQGRGDHSYALWVIPGVLFVPIVGLLMDLGTATVLFWWAMFTIVAASEYVSVRGKQKLIRKLRFRKRDFSRFLALLWVLLAVVLFWIWSVANTNLLSILT